MDKVELQVGGRLGVVDWKSTVISNLLTLLLLDLTHVLVGPITTGTGEHGRVLPSRTPSPVCVPSPSAAGDHAHEERPRRSTPLDDTSAPRPDGLSGRSSWARRLDHAARDHVTPT